MVANRRNLTDTRIDALTGDGQRRPELRDLEVPGLIVRAASKRKVFALHARFPGQKHPTRRVIAEVGTISIDEARRIARNWHELIRRGTDPADDARRRAAAEQAKREAEERKNDSLFELVAEDYLKRKVAGQRQEPAVRRMVRNVLIPAWGDKPIGKISRADVVKLVEQIDEERQAPVYALAIFGTARTLFRWAINRGRYLIEHSPCDQVDATALVSRPKKPRQRVLDDDELRAFWKGTGRLPYPWKELFRMILLTGARKTEMAGARWREFDLQRKVWTVPAARFKSEVSHQVPLTEQMCEILETMPRFKHGDHLFSFTFGKTPTLILHQAKAKLDVMMMRYLKALARMRGEDPDEVTLLQFMPGNARQWGAHDLRRTLRTRLSELGVDDAVAELTIGHARRGLQRVYDQSRRLPQIRAALELWSAELRRITSGEPPATNVVPMRKEG
jgi:integrase